MKVKDLLADYNQLPEYLVTETGCTSVFSKSGFGNFPINIAAARGKIEELQVLVESGSDINQTGEHGYTPLHEAVEQGYAEVVRFLLSRGADTEIKNDDGDTAYDHAKMLGVTVIENLFTM